MSKALKQSISTRMISSDSSQVLSAGWEAMQAVNPRLAAAVQNMPPEIAQNVLLQYTNAIRLGKPESANEMALTAARDMFANYKPPETPTSLMQSAMFGKSLTRNVTGASNQINDYGSLEKFMAEPTEQSAWSGSGFTLMGKVRQTPEQQQAAAFGKVNDAYSAYNNQQDEYSKNLLWGKPADRDLTLPANGQMPWQQGENPYLPQDNNYGAGG
jgi:hypothetical protein